jgi:hypothetical protein
LSKNRRDEFVETKWPHEEIHQEFIS